MTTVTAQPKRERRFTGVVVSDKMQKTRVVLVSTAKLHPKYRKQYTVSTRFKVHDETNATKTGDRVTFVECRPISKDKRWRITS